MLYTLRHSPWQCDFTTFLSLLAPGDDVLLLQDGVITALAGNPFVEKLLNVPVSVSVLQNDVDARGLSAQISAAVVRVSYTEFVSLTVKHYGQMCW